VYPIGLCKSPAAQHHQRPSPAHQPPSTLLKNEDPIGGCQIGTIRPILHANRTKCILKSTDSGRLSHSIVGSSCCGEPLALPGHGATSDGAPCYPCMRLLHQVLLWHLASDQHGPTRLSKKNSSWQILRTHMETRRQQGARCDQSDIFKQLSRTLLTTQVNLHTDTC
jgi:hypothetical protein